MKNKYVILTGGKNNVGDYLIKYFILDLSISGSDTSFTMNEAEFTTMVKAFLEEESATGVVNYTLTEKQNKGKDFFSFSI